MKFKVDHNPKLVEGYSRAGKAATRSLTSLLTVTSDKKNRYELLVGTYDQPYTTVPALQSDEVTVTCFYVLAYVQARDPKCGRLTAMTAHPQDEKPLTVLLSGERTLDVDSVDEAHTSALAKVTELLPAFIAVADVMVGDKSYYKSRTQGSDLASRVNENLFWSPELQDMSIACFTKVLTDDGPVMRECIDAVLTQLRADGRADKYVEVKAPQLTDVKTTDGSTKGMLQFNSYACSMFFHKGKPGVRQLREHEERNEHAIRTWLAFISAYEWTDEPRSVTDKLIHAFKMLLI